MNRVKEILIGICAFVLGCVLGAGAVLVFTPKSSLTTEEITRLKTIPDAPVSEGVEYRNEQYGFSLEHPVGLVNKVFDEGGGASTIVFQSPDDPKVSFQIYITPYGESTITGDRILYDASGQVSELEEVLLREDFRVAMFKSEAPILGDTREIWWLHEGHLFEATSYLTLDSWFQNIIKTVEFF